MRKKRAITLLEIMIVILLIGLIGGVVSYNLKGTLDKGKKFRSDEGAKKLQDILNYEISAGTASVAEILKIPASVVTKSGFISPTEVEKFLLDGFGRPYNISQADDGSIQVKVQN